MCILIGDAVQFSWDDHITPAILLLIYKAVHDLTPSYIVDLIEQFQPSRMLHCLDSGLLGLHLSIAGTVLSTERDL